MKKFVSFKRAGNVYRGKYCMKKFVSFKRAGNEDN